MTKEDIIELARRAGFERLGHTAEDWVCHFEDIEEFTKLVADFTKNSQPEQEPLAWISTGPANMIHWTADKPAYGDDWVPLYTTSPQRKPLTDEQIIASNYPDGEENGPTIAAPDFELICFARQIEAAHGILEQGENKND